MPLKGTRKILSVILSVFIAISCFGVVASTVLTATFGDVGYFSSKFVTDQIVAECEKQLDMKYDALEQKSGIPARVFTTIKGVNNTRNAMIQAVGYVFDENDPTLYNDYRIENFYNLCVEYLEGNELEYDENSVMLVAQEAAMIYSDTVGIHNADELRYYVTNARVISQRVSSIFALALVISVFMLLLIFKQKDKGVVMASSGFIAGGIGGIISAILAIVTKVGMGYSISPAVYQMGVYSTVRGYMIKLAVASVIILAIGVAALAAVAYKQHLEHSQKDTKLSQLRRRLDLDY